MTEFVYRPEIDGLRAIAVLAVFFFHLDENYVSGGFVGVDIFFVISGFLITSIVVKNIRAEEFSILDFYDKRFRRILPALIAILLAVLLAGYFIYTPDDFGRLGEQTVYAAFGISNFYFLEKIGYFAAAAETQPLLHTWSLAVEEQFYVFWPITLICLYKLNTKNFGRNVIAFLVATILVSLYFSVKLSTESQSFAFYMLPTRAWELSLGAIVAFAPAPKRSSKMPLNVVGIIMIFGSLILLTDNMRFPGWVALLPCTGTALLLVPKARHDFVTELLSLRPMVGVGKISYSLYLWHWPLIVFLLPLNRGVPPSVLQSILLIVVAIFLSSISYFIIEKPFRGRSVGAWHGKSKAAAPKVICTGLTAVVGCAAMGSYISSEGGLADRIPLRLQNYLSYSHDPANQGGTHECFLSGNTGHVDQFNVGRCMPKPDGSPRILLIGESFAEQYEIALNTVFPDTQLSTATASGCHPGLPIDGSLVCTELLHRVISEYIPKGNFDAVIIAAKWSSLDYPKIGAFIKEIEPHVDEVIVLGRPNLYRDRMPVLLVRSELAVGDRSLIVDPQLLESSSRDDAGMRTVSEGAGATYYSTLDVTCPQSECFFTTPDDKPLQHDYGHLSKDGSAFVLRALRDQGMLNGVLEK